MKDQLSALIDNELSAEDSEKLIDRMLESDDLQKSWAGAHTASALINQQQKNLDGEVLLASAGFAERVSALIEAEETVFAPNALPQHVMHGVADGATSSHQALGQPAVNSQVAADVASLPAANSSRYAPLYALAASLALVAVLFVVPINRDIDGGNGVAEVGYAASDTALMAETTTDAGANTGAASAASTIVSANANEIEALMVEHGEFSGVAALNGLLAYAKVVNGESAASVQ